MINRQLTMAAAATVLVGCAVIASHAAAPAAPPQAHVRGTIKSLSGSVLTVATATGAVHIQLGKGLGVVTVVHSSRDQIKPGSFVGITSVIGPNGVERAVEVHVFPESMRGAGEGTRPWDWPGTGGGHSRMTNGTIVPRSRMTNGTVAGPAGAASVTVKYKDPTGSGSQAIAVPAGIPVVTFAPGSPTDLKPGSRVFVIDAKGPDGTVTANRVLVGKDGVAPPM